MRLKLMRFFTAVGCLMIISGKITAQNCIPTNINGTVFNLLCNQVCSTLVFQVPHIKSSEDYSLVSVPYVPYPYSTPTGNEDPILYADDQYSFLVGIPFNFCFYGANYTSTVVGSNGIMTFDPANASCPNAWPITTTIPFAGGSICSAGSTYYPKASIMGAYSDLDPRTIASPNNRKIQWEVIGTAPCRKFVVSYYRVGVYGNTCGYTTPNTFQMVIHESTGIIEIFTEQKACFSTTNAGRGIQGIQDWTRTKAKFDPARNNTTWSENNTGVRFIPSGATSLFVISELLDMNNVVVATADTATTVAGLLDISFLNFCTPPGSNQFVVRTRFAACDNPANILESRDTITINRTNSLNATATTTPASCGPPDGMITVTVPAGIGTPPYTFVLDGSTTFTGPSPHTFNNVAAGPHTVVVTDASSGCTSTINVTVILNGIISATTTTTPTACIGVNNGRITITSAGGTGPYTFSLDGAPAQAGVIPYTFNNVAVGIHTVVVNDLGTGCNSGPLSVTVSAGAGVTGSATTTPTACIGASTGSIIVTALTGTPPFTWSLDGGATQAGPSPYTFFNVSAGIHVVTIWDNFNCNTLVVANVASGPGVIGSATSTPTSCPSATDGTIIVTTTSGTPPFTWSLDGAPAQNGPSPYTFFNVAAGAHFITITDNLGCTLLVPVTVNAGAALTATTTTTQTACPTATNGTVIVTSANGTPPYTFTIDGGPSQAGVIPYTFNNVGAGNHIIVVTDVAGCATAPITVTVAAGPGVSGNAVTTATSCPSAANGSIIVTATVGFAPFTWVLDGGPTQNGASPYTFNNVAAGSHTILITDNFGCTLTLNNVVVNAGPVLTANTTTTATTCSGATDGSITVTPVGGATPFAFVLDGGPPFIGPSPHVFNNLAAGNHTILVTDAVGCATSIISVTVTAGPVLTTTVSTTDVLCNGGATGVITVAVPVMGTPPYQYSLDNVIWQASNVFNGRMAGNYTVYYKESNGCQGSQPVVVAEPPVLTASSAIVPVICNGQNNGTITITAGGGVSPYQYSIDGGANWQAGNFFNVAIGNYNVLIRDINNCITALNNIAVTEPAALTASSVNTDASCNGGNDGMITVTANGGNNGYQYSIDGINFQVPNIFNVAPGTYTVTVKDNLGCTTTFPATVGLGNNLTFIKQTDPTICEGTSTQLLFTSNATVYSWTPSTGLSNTGIPNPVANPTVTTQYFVTATLDRCVVDDTVIVNVNTAPVPDAGAAGFICYGQSYQLQATGGVQYAWTPATYLDNAAIPNPVSSATKTITYTLSIISDLNGCASLVTDNVTVDVTPPIKINTFPYDTIGYPGDQIQLQAISAVPAANIFTWTPTINLSDPNISNPIVTAVNVGDEIIYRVTATSIAGCKGEGFVRVRVYKGPELYVPSAFTPNGDGLNEIFYPFPVGIKSINYFKVFNRWGQLVFSSETLYKGWDGKVLGLEQPTGVYVFMAQGIDKNNKVLTRRGNVTLIR